MCIRDRFQHALVDLLNAPGILFDRELHRRTQRHVHAIADAALAVALVGEQRLPFLVGDDAVDLGHAPVSYTHLDVYKRQR